jgi:hypothetical protein
MRLQQRYNGVKAVWLTGHGQAGWSQVQTPGPLSLASDGSSLDSNFMRRTRAGAARRDHTSPRFVASTGAAPVSIFIHDTQDDAHATLEAGRVQDGMGGGCADKSDPRHRAPLASCHALLALSDRARFKSANLFRARLLPDSQGRDAGATGARGHVLAPSQLHGLTRFECLRKTLCAWLTSDAIDYEYFRAKATPSP